MAPLESQTTWPQTNNSPLADGCQRRIIYPTSWWFQQIWNICSSNCSISPRRGRGEHIKRHIWNHQPDFWLPKEKKHPTEGSWYLAPEVPHPMMTVWLSFLPESFLEDTQRPVFCGQTLRGRVGRFQHVVLRSHTSEDLSMKSSMIHGCKNFPGCPMSNMFWMVFPQRLLF